MKPFLRSGDFWSGLVLAALGTYIVVTAHGWDYMTEEGPGAGFFPMWYGGVMVVLSLLLVLGTVLKPRAATSVAWKDIWRAMTAWVGFVACIALMPVVGFIIAFGLLTAFIVKVMCGEKIVTALIVAAVGSVGFYLLFEVALELTLPHGILF